MVKSGSKSGVGLAVKCEVIFVVSSGLVSPEWSVMRLSSTFGKVGTMVVAGKLSIEV